MERLSDNIVELIKARMRQIRAEEQAASKAAKLPKQKGVSKQQANIPKQKIIPHQLVGIPKQLSTPKQQAIPVQPATCVFLLEEFTLKMKKQVTDLRFWTDEELNKAEVLHVKEVPKDELLKLEMSFLKNMVQGIPFYTSELVLIYRHLINPEQQTEYLLGFDTQMDPIFEKIYNSIPTSQPTADDNVDTKTEEPIDPNLSIISGLSSEAVMILAPVVAGICLRMMSKSYGSTKNTLANNLQKMMKNHYGVDIPELSINISNNSLISLDYYLKAGQNFSNTAMIPTLRAFKAAHDQNGTVVSNRKKVAGILNNLLLMHTRWTGMKLFEIVYRISTISGRSVAEVISSMDLQQFPSTTKEVLPMLSKAVTYHEQNKSSVIWNWARVVDNQFYAPLTSNYYPDIFMILLFVLDLNKKSTIHKSVVFKKAECGLTEKDAKVHAREILKKLGLSKDVFTLENRKLKKKNKQKDGAALRNGGQKKKNRQAKDGDTLENKSRKKENGAKNEATPEDKSQKKENGAKNEATPEDKSQKKENGAKNEATPEDNSQKKENIPKNDVITLENKKQKKKNKALKKEKPNA